MMDTEPKKKPDPISDSIRLALELGGCPIAVHSITDNGECTCGKGAHRGAGKHPVRRQWQALTELPQADRKLIMAGHYNLGFSVGENALVLDFDGEEGLKALEELDAKGLPRSLRARTGSGGVHVYFKLPPAWRGKFRNSVKKLADGVDVRANGGQVLMPPSKHASGRRYEWMGKCDVNTVEELPEEFIQEHLVQLAPAPVDEAVSKSTGLRVVYSVDNPQDVAEAVRYIDRLEAKDWEHTEYEVFQFGLWCRDHGISEDMAVEIFLNSRFNQRCVPQWTAGDKNDPNSATGKIHNAYRYGKGIPGVKASTAKYIESEGEPPMTHNARVLAKCAGVLRGDWLTDVNDKFFWVNEGGSVRICYRRPDGGVVWMKKADWEAWMGGVFVMIENKRVPMPKAWFRSERVMYDGSGMYPPGAECPKNIFNTWPGFPFERVDMDKVEGSCERFKHHLREVVCGGDEQGFAWLWQWLAHMVQRPHELPGTAVILRSEREGTGKSVVGEYLRRMLGNELAFITGSPDDIAGMFSGHLRDKLLLVGNEVVFHGNHKLNDKLKSLIADDMISIRAMRMDSVMRPNYLRVLLTSNHDAVVNIVRGDARRYTVFDMDGAVFGDGTEACKRRYFKELWQELNGSGPLALWKELREYQLRGEINIFEAYRGHGFVKMRHANMSRKEWRGWLYDVLDVDGLCEDMEDDMCVGNGIFAKCEESKDGCAWMRTGPDGESDVVAIKKGPLVRLNITNLAAAFIYETGDRFVTLSTIRKKMAEVIGGERKNVKLPSGKVTKFNEHKRLATLKVRLKNNL